MWSRQPQICTGCCSEARERTQKCWWNFGVMQPQKCWCVKSALFAFGFCQRALGRSGLPPLPPFTMVTRLEVWTSTPLQHNVGNCQMERHAVCAETAKKPKTFLGITRWADSACKDDTLDCWILAQVILALQLWAHWRRALHTALFYFRYMFHALLLMAVPIIQSLGTFLQTQHKLPVHPQKEHMQGLDRSCHFH